MPSGTFNLAGDSATARFCMVPFNRDAATVDNALNSLNGALAGATVTTQAVFSANVWLTNAFNCDPDLTFNTNGTANREVYIAIVGQRNGSMIVNGPVGIILVTTSGNIYRYFRADNTSNWTKL
jgi:hypothetical protein